MQPLRRLLIANRAEIAIRIARAAADEGIETVAVYARDDARCLHVGRADRAAALGSAGPRAYLDIESLVAVAREQGCDSVHPGYGFLAESADFARACRDAGLAFVGPTAAQLELFGDKARARALAESLSIPVVEGLSHAVDLPEALAFFDALGGAPVVIKALAGGGGRGMRVVRSRDQLASAFEQCRREAAAAFGSDALYVERLAARARHVEVQIAGDASGNVAVLGERECSLQRRHQKIVEWAPSRAAGEALASRLAEAATQLAARTAYEGLGTVEFLVGERGDSFHFLEMNPRLQVEHPVTEETTGIDLVRGQLRLAAGATLAQAGFEPAPRPRGLAIELRVCMETMAADASVKASGGVLSVYEPPSGPGVRVDGFGYAGYRTAPAFDSLLAKVVVRADDTDFPRLVERARRALAEFRIEGVATNLGFLRSLLARPEVEAGNVTTSFLDEHAAEVVAGEAKLAPAAFFGDATARPRTMAGVRVDDVDPLAVVAHGKTRRAGAGSAMAGATGHAESDPSEAASASGWIEVAAAMQGTIVSLAAGEGDAVGEGAELLVMEAMKMQHVVAAPSSGIVREVAVEAGDTVFEGHVLVRLEAADVVDAAGAAEVESDPDRVRPDLVEAIERHRLGLDEARGEAVAKRHGSGRRTARENLADLCDEGSFVEYGALAIAAQRRRRELDDLIRRTPADGMICGIATVGADAFGRDAARTAVVSYDYTVLAGTQGLQNHRKKDRIFEIAYEQRLPVVILTEGGGGRPGDTDGTGIAGLDCRAFQWFGRLSGLVPLVGVNAGRCFAGNAALLGCCDVVIATADSSIGMGGPAMIEGGGLGVFHPDEVGPMRVQAVNGVVDVAVANEAEAVAAAKRYLAFFRGRLPAWEAEDQRLLRQVVPENRLRVYEVRRVIEILADRGSVMELRRGFGAGMVTALARIEGRAVGIVANDPRHLAGAIDVDAADKAARFLQLCDAFDLPVVSLCDTPGIMVGPEIEKRAMVRHAARLFVVGASLTVPLVGVVLRKGYGLGAQAMMGGSFHASMATLAWPTGEFGGMGLEGAVKLGFQKELAAVADPAERRALFERMVAHAYEIGKAVSMASAFEIDDVIDPAETRARVAALLAAAAPPPPRSGKKRPCVDTW